MPHVAIANVIGTIGLLALLSIVVIISTTTSLQSSAQTVQVGLQEVASYVSNQIVAVGSLAASSQDLNVLAYKVLVLPPALGVSGYAVMIVNDSGCKVMAYVENNPRINANASLNFVGGIGIIQANITGSPVLITNLVHSGEGSSLASATFTAVIVYQSVNGSAAVGLGVSPVGRNL